MDLLPWTLVLWLVTIGLQAPSPGLRGKLRGFHKFTPAHVLTTPNANNFPGWVGIGGASRHPHPDQASAWRVFPEPETFAPFDIT
jgi:hypothetical protein